MKLLDAGGSDFAGISSTSASTGRAWPANLTRSLDTLKTGNARTPALSPTLSRC